MVIQVGFPQTFEPLGLRVPEVMNTVVRHVVSQVTQSKPGRISPYQRTENRQGQGKQHHADYQAERDRHDQAFFVIRVLVVYTVKQETHAFLEFTPGRKVKNIAVQDVLEHSPKHNTRQEQNPESRRTYTYRETFPDGESDHRQINRQHCPRGDPAESFQQFVFK